MKNYFALCIYSVFLFAIMSCGSKTSSNTATNANTDALGESDSLSPYFAQQVEGSKIVATINGREVEFKFLDNLVFTEKQQVFNISESADGKYSIAMFELATDEKMKEKISLSFLNIVNKGATPPIDIKNRKENMQARIDLNIQKSNVFINYFNQDFVCTITEISEQSLKGTFAGEVKNTGGRVIKVEKGEFDIKIKKTEMKVQ